MARVDEPVSVVMSPDGWPLRIEWRSQQFRVTDVPTRLGSFPDLVLEFVTHPPRGSVGWRFQGTDDHGISHVFDITRDPSRDQWLLRRTYD